MSLLKPPTTMPHPHPHPHPPQLMQRPFLGCEPMTEADADMDSDSEQERTHLDDEDAAIDVEADEEQESGSSAPSATPSKSSLCLESKENAGQHKEVTAAAVDKSANQKAY
ncbi:uncharacterized protein LOC108038363 [Drosophila rhopaloa]|uniref:Uncharacterized protein LOC108038363 n=1 Tax=Drosophila rhopaloa TaxID=1041015 RepID=A0A6P4DY57_DRORH|nr:uncharacterized protein LOC108038363 [Drosophila rhopaloa]